MTAPAIAERLHARSTAHGKWIAKCPAHDDRRPSLSIGEGRDGRPLLHCWRGCELVDILRAAGLVFDDLFVDAKPARRYDEFVAVRRQYRDAPREAVEALLAREVERQRLKRLERDPNEVQSVRSVDVNRARSRSNEILGTRLKPIAPYWWETCAPHDHDPLWPLCLQRAAAELRWERFPDASRPPRADVEDRAALILHDLARSSATEAHAGARAA